MNEREAVEDECSRMISMCCQPGCLDRGGDAVFNSRSEGGTVILACPPSFWAKGAGTLTNRFGTSRNINGEVAI